MPYHVFRFVVQDSGSLPASLLREVLGPLYVLHIVVQYLHEDLLHLVDRIYNLPHEIQKTLLHGKYPSQQSLSKLFLVTLICKYYRPMTRWATISRIGLPYSPQPSY